MSSYKSVPTEFTVEEALDTLEIQDLRDEMQEWVDNMSGTGLENTSRYEMAEEAVSELDRVDDIDFDEIWDAIPENCIITAEDLKAIKFTCSLYTPKSRKQHPSRSYRLSNAICHITDALEEMREYIDAKLDGKDTPEDIRKILEAIDSVESSVQDLDSVDFPGMFG